MTIKTNTDLRLEYHYTTDGEAVRSISNCDGTTRMQFAEEYVLWLENRIIAVERAFQGVSREYFRK